MELLLESYDRSTTRAGTKCPPPTLPANRFKVDMRKYGKVTYLDFDTFVIAQPESSTTPIVTNCIDARFSTTSQGATMPVLCGTNTGKHS